MLHFEILENNGVHSAYRVDHNPDAPQNSVLFIGESRWENFDGYKTPYYYSFAKNNNEKWVIREGVENDPGGDAGYREVSVLFSENDNILGIVIALFNAAPGKFYLDSFSEAISTGLIEPELADLLAANSVFTNGVMGDKLTPDAQVVELMNHFGLVADGKQGSAASIAENFFRKNIESGVGHGEIAAIATFYLLGNPLLGNEVAREFSSVSQLFKLKIRAADNYSANISSTDLGALQAVLAGITFYIGTEASEMIIGKSGVIEGGWGGDVITLEVAQGARDILLLKDDARDSRILNIAGGAAITIREDNNNLFLDNVGYFSKSAAADAGDSIEASSLILGNDISNSFFDVVTNFSEGTADTDDRIDLSSFNFSGTQAVLLDVSARVSLDTDLTSISDLFSDGIAGDHGLAFLEYSDASVLITFLFVDANKDGNFTAADDLFVALVGVDDLINANFIYFPGDIGSVSEPPIDPLTFILTVAADTMIGSSNNDLFSAPVAQIGSANFNTLQSADILNGVAGFDTVTATLTNENLAPALLNIESIDARFTDFGVLDLSNATGVQQITVQQSTSGGTVRNFSNVDILSVKNQNQGVLFSGSGTEVRNLIFENVGASQDIGDQVGFDLAGVTVTGTISTKNANVALDTLVIDEFLIIAATGENRISFESSQDTVTNITVTGSGSVDLTDASFSAVQRVNGVANLGGISVDASASTFSTDFLGSPADDHFTSSTNGGIITANGGQDTITLNAFFAFDTLIFAAGDSVLNADMASHDIINNFGTADGDIIDLSAFGFTGEQASALADKGTLANSSVDGSVLFVPDFFSSAGVDRGVAIGINGNDSYVFVDASKDGDFNAADDLFIKLTGVDIVTLANFAL